MRGGKRGSRRTPVTKLPTNPPIGGHYLFYHGTDLVSALALVNGKVLNEDDCDGRKIDGPPGFFLADREADVEYFASRRLNGGIIRVRITEEALFALIRGGADLRPIPVGFRQPKFAGNELYVPTSCFRLFNDCLRAGDIEITP